MSEAQGFSAPPPPPKPGDKTDLMPPPPEGRVIMGLVDTAPKHGDIHIPFPVFIGAWLAFILCIRFFFQWKDKPR